MLCNCPYGSIYEVHHFLTPRVLPYSILLRSLAALPAQNFQIHTSSRVPNVPCHNYNCLFWIYIFRLDLSWIRSLPYWTTWWNVFLVTPSILRIAVLSSSVVSSVVPRPRRSFPKTTLEAHVGILTCYIPYYCAPSHLSSFFCVFWAVPFPDKINTVADLSGPTKLRSIALLANSTELFTTLVLGTLPFQSQRTRKSPRLQAWIWVRVCCNRCSEDIAVWRVYAKVSTFAVLSRVDGVRALWAEQDGVPSRIWGISNGWRWYRISM